MHAGAYCLKILVTFALENEFSPWRRVRRFQESERGSVPVFIANMGVELTIVLTGAGPKHAASAVTEIFGGKPGEFDLCISAGLCGALRSEYRIGEIVAGRTVCTKLADRGDGRQEIGSDQDLYRLAVNLGARAVDRFCTMDHVAGTRNEKHKLGEVAEIVEMESFSVMREAAKSGVRGIAIRAISDAADEDLPLDMDQIFGPNGTVSMHGVAGQIARHPLSIPGLIRLGRQSRHAAQKLADYLDNYVVALVQNPAFIERVECLS